MRQGWYKLITKNLLLGIFCTLLYYSVSFAFPNIEGIQFYQKSFRFSAERKQSLADDIDRYHNADNMWDILRSEFILQHYTNDPTVQAQLEFFLNNQDFLLRSAARAAPYLYYISQQVRKRHLPAEIVLLPMIESAYNPFAYSSAGAGGIWQMMPNTASGFGIKQNWWYDGRRDVIASTKAALDYLVYLGGFFDGNWLLALAAYNTGEGNVLAAIHRNIRDGKSTDFWSLPLAQQTREYVPRLLALAIIIANPERYPINFPPVHNAPYLAQVDVGGQIDLNHAAYLAGLSLHTLKQLNSGYNRTSTDPNGPYKLVLPIQNVEQFSENLMRSPFYKKINIHPYKVKLGDTLIAIAKKFKTTSPSLRKLNSLGDNTVTPGSHLLVPELIPAITQSILETTQPYLTASSENTTANDSLLNNVHEHYTLQPGDTLYMVRNGDNLLNIAARFHISPHRLLVTNQLKSIQPVLTGTKLIIPTHLSKIHAIQKYQLAPGDTIYVVREGDTIEKIANKFHTTPPTLRVANLLMSSIIQPGDRLVIPTHG
jgi:membrane-bound lytic murein transglycosylase D